MSHKERTRKLSIDGTDRSGIILSEDFALVPLSRNAYVKIDVQDMENVIIYRWFASCPYGNNLYAARNVKMNNGKRTVVLLHREIMSAIGYENKIDHINGDTLDCRRSNLRICSNQLNGLNRARPNKNNSSGYTGIRLSANRDKWIACITIGGFYRQIGRFHSIEEAIKARADYLQRFLTQQSRHRVSASGVFLPPRTR